MPSKRLRPMLNVTFGPIHLAYLNARAAREVCRTGEVLRRLVDREIERELKRPALAEDIAKFNQEAETLRGPYVEAHRARLAAKAEAEADAEAEAEQARLDAEYEAEQEAPRA